jgi:broad specificity phosphatase PhoE
MTRRVSPKIILVRHGRSQHVQTGLMDHDGFLRWREHYEAAGIDETQLPPPELQQIAASAGVIVASDTARGEQSAKLLGTRGEIITTPLLRELALAPLKIRGIKLPLIAWALSFAVRWLRPLSATYPLASDAEVARAREAAEFLIREAATHGTVIAVTHASFRAVLAIALIERGWRAEFRKRNSAHWSAWPFTNDL